MVCQVVQPPPPFQTNPTAYLPNPVINRLRPCCFSLLIAPKPINNEKDFCCSDSGYGGSPINEQPSSPLLPTKEGDYFKAQKITFTMNGIAYLESGKRYIFVESARCPATPYFASSFDFVVSERFSWQQFTNPRSFHSVETTKTNPFKVEQGLYELTPVESFKDGDEPISGNCYTLFLSNERKNHTAQLCECQVMKAKENIHVELKARLIMSNLFRGLEKATELPAKSVLVKSAVLRLARLEPVSRSDRATGGIFGQGPTSLQSFKPLELLKDVVTGEGFQIPPKKHLPFTTTSEDEGISFINRLEFLLG
jgi:hypothetical protein